MQSIYHSQHTVRYFVWGDEASITTKKKKILFHTKHITSLVHVPQQQVDWKCPKHLKTNKKEIRGFLTIKLLCEDFKHANSSVHDSGFETFDYKKNKLF